MEVKLGYETPEEEVNLSNSFFGIEDLYVQHPSGLVRIIRYPRPSETQLQIRNKLISKDLIAGKLRSEIDEFEQHFLIPHETTPVNNYLTNRNGEKIAYQLGGLLHNLTNIDNNIFVLSGDLNNFVVISDHKSESYNLQFTPGVELAINRYVGSINPNTLINYYAEQFNAFSYKLDLLEQFQNGYLNED